jgi:hypothetical protein
MRYSALAAVWLLLPVGVVNLAAQDAARPPPGNIKLLPGYVHEPKQGFDSIVGLIEKKGGLTIMYEIGRVAKPGALALGGDFSDRAKNLKEIQRQWYKEQTIAGQAVHIAMAKDGGLYVSFPESGVNFSVMIKTAEDVADALLMILSYQAEKK